MVETVTIDHLGGLGDGVAETAAGRLHIPFAAPGDQLRVERTGKDSGKIVELLQAGPDRTEPACAHFGRCGGCALQHLTPAFTAAWKRARVTTALARADLGDTPVDPTISIPPGVRRRATLAAKRFGKRVTLGFTERASHLLVDLMECPVLRPELTALIPLLRESLLSLLEPAEAADIALTLTNSGIDLVLIRARSLTLADRENLAALGEAQNLARISWRPKVTAPAEPVSEWRTPSVQFGVQAVSLPQGGFLQPSAEGEAKLRELILSALNGQQKSIVDLFSGLGAFTLPASALGPISAFDGDRDAIAALRSATRGRTGISAHCRDLFREPLTPKELNEFSAAIIDPPRAGALAQAKTLAQSEIATIAAVSCNPTSFARDAAILIEGGYRLERVTPVDQFLWSPHVELFGIFRR